MIPFTIAHFKINLFHLESFEDQFRCIKRNFSMTAFELSPEEEVNLKVNYDRIMSSPHLNVEPLIFTLSLKEDYINNPVSILKFVENHRYDKLTYYERI